MNKEIWYTIEPHSEKFDLSRDGKPIRYVLDKDYAEKFTTKMWPQIGEIHETNIQMLYAI